MKILITGVKGFIGFHLYNSLDDNNIDLIGIDNCSGYGNNERFIENYIKESFEKVKEFDDIDVLVHLAGKTGVRESLKNPDIYFEENLNKSDILFKNYNYVKKIVYASSSSVKEVLNPYAQTKLELEQIAPAHSIGLRFHTVYGPLGRPDMLIRKLQEDKCNYITNHNRDFTHVYDVVEALKICIFEDVQPGIYDVGFGESVPVKKVAELMGKNLPYKTVQNEMTSTLSDISKLTEYGWTPKINIEKGLKLI